MFCSEFCYTVFPKKRAGTTCWRLAVGSWWRLAVGSWRLVAVGDGWWLLVVGDWWLVVVGGPWGRFLRAVLSKKKLLGALVVDCRELASAKTRIDKALLQRWMPL